MLGVRENAVDGTPTLDYLHTRSERHLLRRRGPIPAVRATPVDAAPQDSGAEDFLSHHAPEFAIDSASDTRTHAGPTVSAAYAPTRHAPVPTGNDRLAEADDFAGPHTQGSEDRGVLARFSPRAQAAISAALLIPTMVLYFVWFQSLHIEKSWKAFPAMAGLALVLGLYFIVVVAVVTRIQSRKHRALLVAAIAVVLDTLIGFLSGLPPDSARWVWLLHLLIIFLYVRTPDIAAVPDR